MARTLRWIGSLGVIDIKVINSCGLFLFLVIYRTPHVETTLDLGTRWTCLKRLRLVSQNLEETKQQDSPECFNHFHPALDCAECIIRAGKQCIKHPVYNAVC